MGLFNRFPRKPEPDLSVVIEKAAEIGWRKGYKEGFIAGVEQQGDLCDTLLADGVVHPEAVEILQMIGRNSRTLAAQIEAEVEA